MPGKRGESSVNEGFRKLRQRAKLVRECLENVFTVQEELENSRLKGEKIHVINIAACFDRTSQGRRDFKTY